MAEHEEQLFEHQFEAMLKNFDENIKIPEVPDAQSIFDRAEEQKGKVIPFKKYSKYIAAAAAVVLICVSIPALSKSLSSDNLMFDAKSGDAEAEFFEEVAMVADQETPELPEAEEYSTTNSSAASAVSSSVEASVEEPAANTPNVKNDFEKVLTEYFSTNYDYLSGKELEAGNDSDSLRTVEDYINKKRGIEITVEEDSVSVLLRDNAKEPEIINAFWVEGVYQKSYFDEASEKYVIELTKKLTKEEFESGYYLPMAGDSEKGTYTLLEEDITVPGKITQGIINITVEISVGTGKYEIKAEII